MKQEYKKIFLLYLMLVVVKIGLSFFVQAPSVFSDEYVYTKLARSLFYDQSMCVHDFSAWQQPVLYPLVLSSTYVLKEMSLIYSAMKIVNVLLLTSVIFPIYLLAKDFVSEKRALFVALLVSMMPMFVVTPFYIMSENLFYPLFLFWVYFLYRGFKENSLLFFNLAGLFLGLCVLTRIISLVLLPIPLLVWLFRMRRIKFSKIVIMYLITTLALSPWLLKEYIFPACAQDPIVSEVAEQGDLIDKYFGVYANSIKVKLGVSLTQIPLTFLNWVLLYVGYLVLASGVLFGLYSSLAYKEQRGDLKVLVGIIALAGLFLIIAAANHSTTKRIFFETPFFFFTGRPIGRYVEAVLPLIVMLGMIMYEKVEKVAKKWFVALGVFLAFAAQLTIAPLFPFNNSSLSLIGVIKYGLDAIFAGSYVDTYTVVPTLIVLAMGLAALPFIFMKKKSWHPYLVLIFFMLSSVAALGITYYASEQWYKSDQMQLGLEIKNLDPEISTIIFDERDCAQQIARDSKEICESSKKSTIAGFWLNDNIKIGDIYTEEADLIITKHHLNLTMVKHINGEFFVYKA